MKETQILVDGFYIAYRSAYAYSELSTSDGRPTGLVYGFISVLRKIANQWPSAEIVVCWDTPSSWRKDIYPEYKAGRDGSAKDKTQIEATADFCAAIGIRQCLARGQEADDVIGSLIDPEKNTIIYSRDRDFCQLVEDSVCSLYSPKSGIHEHIHFFEEEVFDKYGVTGDKLLIFRALRGDSSDNLPGMPRFPSKKMLELLRHHDNIEDLLHNPHESVKLTERQKTLIREHRTQGTINYTLMRIRRDVEVSQYQQDPSRNAAQQILNTFELKSLGSVITLFEDRGDVGLMGLFDL